MKLTIEIHGDTETDLRHGLLAIKDSLEQGNTSGFDRRDTGHYRFSLQDEAERVLSWTYACCSGCWAERCLARRETVSEPVRLQDPKTEICCFCKRVNQSGIYVRHDPEDLTCSHPEEL